MNFNNKNILITGGTGSFGQKCVEILLRDYKPKRLIIFSRDELKQYEMSQYLSEEKYPNLSNLNDDILNNYNCDELREICKKEDLRTRGKKVELVERILKKKNALT